MKMAGSVVILHMSKATYSIRNVQNIPMALEDAWSFFSSPDNLQVITPSNLGFTILSKHHGKKIYAGQIIEYTVKPLLGIPVYWMTEITHVVEGQYFVDEQRFGPYQLWHHQHHFKSIEGGVEMTDIVHYRNPMGFLGRIANQLFVKAQLRKIFEFRSKKVEELFGKWPGVPANTIDFNKVDRKIIPA
jgi:ligand-binding SRPBCC domain-containing protein